MKTTEDLLKSPDLMLKVLHPEAVEVVVEEVILAVVVMIEAVVEVETDNPEAEVVVSSAAKKVTFHVNVQTKVKVQEPGAVIVTSAAKKDTFHANALREVRINVSDVKKKDTFHATVLKVCIDFGFYKID